MKIKITRKGQTLIDYVVYSLVICALAGIGFFFDFWEPAAVLFFSSIITFPVLWLNLYSFAKPKTEGSPINGGMVAMLSIGRVLIIGVSIVVAAVLMKFTDGIGGKYRLLYVLLTLVPLMLAHILFYIESSKEGTTGGIVDDEAFKVVEEIEAEVADEETLKLEADIKAKEKELELQKKKLEDLKKEK